MLKSFLFVGHARELSLFPPKISISSLGFSHKIRFLYIHQAVDGNSLNSNPYTLLSILSGS